MSDRIDLTQFESKHGTELYQKIQDYIRGNDYPDEIPQRIMGLYSGLLAELKRCYKLLDDANDAMSRYGDEEEHQDIDNVCDAYEAVCNALAGLGRWV